MAEVKLSQAYCTINELRLAVEMNGLQLLVGAMSCLNYRLILFTV